MSARHRTLTDTYTEPCTPCGAETPHTVWIEIRTESRRRQNAAYSREPYRVTTCRSCGHTEDQRMNNA